MSKQQSFQQTLAQLAGLTFKPPEERFADLMNEWVQIKKEDPAEEKYVPIETAVRLIIAQSNSIVTGAKYDPPDTLIQFNASSVENPGVLAAFGAISHILVKLKAMKVKEDFFQDLEDSLGWTRQIARRRPTPYEQMDENHLKEIWHVMVKPHQRDQITTMIGERT